MKLVAFAIFTLSLYASGLTGNWRVEQQDPNGNSRKTWFDLNEIGSFVTGLVRAGNGDRAIQEGTIDAQGEVSLTVRLNAERTIHYEGKFADGQLRMFMRRGPDQPPVEVLATRALAGEGLPPARSG